MPTYQYRCTECGHDLEAVQKFTDSALTECPNCGGQLRKVFNAVGVVFKGSGFYRNDSRSADKRSGDGGSGDGGSGDGGSGEGGSGEGGGEKKSDGKETSAPVKEKAGSGREGASAGNGTAKSAVSGSTSSSGNGSSTPAKAAGS